MSSEAANESRCNIFLIAKSYYTLAASPCQKGQRQIRLQFQIDRYRAQSIAATLDVNLKDFAAYRPSAALHTNATLAQHSFRAPPATHLRDRSQAHAAPEVSHPPTSALPERQY